jgi:hypothetical protein
MKEEGVSEKSWHDPPHFFARHIDEYMQEITTQFFELVSFKTIEIGNDKR